MKKNKASSPEKIFLHSFGCKVNQYEAQALREKFVKDGRVFTDKLEDAGTLLIQSCTVTAEADRQCRQLIRQALRVNPRLEIIVSGCYAARFPEELIKLTPSLKILSTGNNFGITGFEGHTRAFVKIQDGCDAFCTYCIVPYVRNKLISRPEKEVISEIENLVKHGCPEIVLTGVRLGKYFPGVESLIKKILAISGGFRVRLSSLEIGEVSQGLLKLMKDNPERVCHHLHLPLQSGSEKILKRMGRPYTAAEFAGKVKEINKVLPDAGISTDIIVGFPGESDSDFEDTLNMANGLIFSRLHVFRYSKREGTAAFGFKETVPAEKIKARSAELRELDKKLQTSFWKRFIGTVRPAVAEGGKNTLLTDNYIRLNTDSQTHSFCNKIVNAEIASNSGRPWGILK